MKTGRVLAYSKKTDGIQIQYKDETGGELDEWFTKDEKIDWKFVGKGECQFDFEAGERQNVVTFLKVKFEGFKPGNKFTPGGKTFGKSPEEIETISKCWAIKMGILTCQAKPGLFGDGITIEAMVSAVEELAKKYKALLDKDWS